jgi:hypothetical protein
MRGMTNDELTGAIKQFDAFSSSLRPLLKEAGRRLQQNQGSDSMRESFRYGTQVLGYLKNEKPKAAGED